MGQAHVAQVYRGCGKIVGISPTECQECFQHDRGMTSTSTKSMWLKEAEEVYVDQVVTCQMSPLEELPVSSGAQRVSATGSTAEVLAWDDGVYCGEGDYRRPHFTLRYGQRAASQRSSSAEAAAAPTPDCGPPRVALVLESPTREEPDVDEGMEMLLAEGLLLPRKDYAGTSIAKGNANTTDEPQAAPVPLDDVDEIDPDPGGFASALVVSGGLHSDASPKRGGRVSVPSGGESPNREARAARRREKARHVNVQAKTEVTEPELAQLLAMGFSQAQAAHALLSSGGDVGSAATALLQQSEPERNSSSLKTPGRASPLPATNLGDVPDFPLAASLSPPQVTERSSPSSAIKAADAPQFDAGSSAADAAGALAQLRSMGFTEEKARRALRDAGGDVDRAVALCL